MTISGSSDNGRFGSRLFHAAFSGALLLVVLLGFGRSLYLRPLFDVPPLPPSVWVHGIVLTAWYLGAFMQASLVAARRVDIHRRLGWFVAGIGAAVIAIGTSVTLNFIGRRASLGANIEARLGFFSDIVWGDLAAIVAFILFFVLAIALRKRSEIHKRLMILASLSILEPALYRIWGWQIFGGVDRNWASLGVLFVAVLVLALHDIRSHRRVFAVTLWGGVLLLGSRMIGLNVIADSEAGLSFIRSLQ